MLKYIDDTKVIGKIDNKRDIENFQVTMNSKYEWEWKNNMKWNGDKFMIDRIGSKSIVENTTLFSPDYEEPIEEYQSARDLGVMFDDHLDFKSHRSLVIKKMNSKISWVLRTFRTRNIEHMRFLWKSIIQSTQDYGNIVWAPVGIKCDMIAQEGPLRQFSKKVKGLWELDYWTRLKKLKMNSIERRVERFRILYTWKSLMGIVPSLGFSIYIHPKKGKMIREIPNKGKVQSVKNKKV